MSDSAGAILAELVRRGVRLNVGEGALYYAPMAAVPAALRERMRRRKAELIRLLNAPPSVPRPPALSAPRPVDGGAASGHDALGHDALGHELLAPVPQTGPLPARAGLGEYLSEYGLTGEAVEVGVDEGRFSEEILGGWRGRTLHLVDVEVRPELRGRLEQFGARAVLHHVDSVGAAARFADGSLDAVYIDADHRYAAARADLAAWWPKVRPGGFFGGHDYLNSADAPTPGRRPRPQEVTPDVARGLPFGVKAAVDEFCARHGLAVHTTGPAETRSPSWFLFKPYRLVTTLDEAYVPGFLALVRSLKRRAGIEFSLTVVLYGPLSDASLARIESLGVAVTFVRKEELGEFRFPRQWTHTPRMAPNFDKILIWRLPPGETACYLDSDILCLNPLRGLPRLEPHSVAMMQSAIGAGPDDDPAYRPSGMYPWNAGVMVFRPDAAVFEAVQRHAATYTGPIRYGDQVILNDYFAEHRRAAVRYLSPNWNMSTWVREKYPRLFDPARVRLLHFAHEAKPWRDRPTHRWMRPFWTFWEHYGAD